MANITMVTVIFRVVASVHRSPNVRRNGKNPPMFILIVDRRNWYSGSCVLTEPWYLIILGSLVAIVVFGISVVPIPNLVFLSISIPVSFCLRWASLGVNLVLSSQKEILDKLTCL